MLRFFNRLKIPSPTPLPVIGNFIGFMNKGVTKFDDELFKNCKSDIVGYFEGSQPVVICKDVDMIKHCMVKDFSHFANRRVIMKNKFHFFSDILLKFIFRNLNYRSKCLVCKRLKFLFKEFRFYLY
jgi:hypothetical protein